MLVGKDVRRILVVALSLLLILPNVSTQQAPAGSAPPAAPANPDPNNPAAPPPAYPDPNNPNPDPNNPGGLPPPPYDPNQGGYDPNYNPNLPPQNQPPNPGFGPGGFQDPNYNPNYPDPNQQPPNPYPDQPYQPPGQYPPPGSWTPPGNDNRPTINNETGQQQQLQQVKKPIFPWLPFLKPKNNPGDSGLGQPSSPVKWVPIGLIVLQKLRKLYKLLNPSSNPGNDPFLNDSFPGVDTGSSSTTRAPFIRGFLRRWGR